MGHGLHSRRGRATAAVVAICVGLVGCTSPGDARADVVDLFVGKGATHEQGECVADGLEQQFGDLRKDWSDYDREDGAAVLKTMIACLGVDLGDTARSRCQR